MSATRSGTSGSDPRGTRHTMPTIREVQRLAGQGHNPTQIQALLKANGTHVSRDAICRWTIPGYAEERDASRTRRKREARGDIRALGPTTGARYARMRQLRSAGLTFTAIAVVMNLDYDLEVSSETVRYLLSTKPTSVTARNIRKHIAPQREREAA